MLTLTTGAAAVLEETRSTSGVGNEMAVRISPRSSNDGQFPGYELHFAPAPAPDDVVLVSAGTRLFLAAEVVQPLAGAVLDAEEADDGRQLVLRRGAVE